MRFDERYATAVRTANLRSDEKTTFSAADVLGAAGIASRKHPLALALLRLFSGDNHASGQILDLLESMLVGKAFRMGRDVDRAAASVMARLALDWFRDSVCKPCGGHGYLRMDGSPTLSDKACGDCSGKGRREFEVLFPPERVDLARWAIAELEREAASAGPAAMAALAPRLTFN